MSGEPYSPARRTALVLSGVGTAGAYHAGALRALHEAGVKIDIVAGQGIGALGALFTAIDGGQRLWDDQGFWRSPVVRRMYEWRPMLRFLAMALLAAATVVTVPLVVIAAGLVVFPIDFVFKITGVSSGGGLVQRYLALAERAAAPDALPTWLPRLVLLILGAALLAALAGVAATGEGRRRRGSVWWRLVRAPLTTERTLGHCWASIWALLRGATSLKAPARLELARRYTELLAENIGQPGFRELLIVTHDLDAGRDLVFALVAESRRAGLLRRPTSEAARNRQAEVVDLCGVGRDHLVDALAGALSVPLVTDPHPVRFAAESYWRGETHRLCDRPAALWRLLEELAQLQVEQAILVAAAPEGTGPHALNSVRADGRGHLGEHIQSAEGALIRDASHAPAMPLRVFAIRPVHNPIGPFEFRGSFDEGSDRREPLAELIARGYEDAYHQFVEPVVGASGEAVGATVP